MIHIVGIASFGILKSYRTQLHGKHSFATYELQLLTSTFEFRSEKFPEGFRLRLVQRGSSDLFTLEEALAHCGVGTIVGTLTDDYSTNAFVISNNQAIANAGLPLAIYCSRSYAGVVISQAANNNSS